MAGAARRRNAVRRDLAMVVAALIQTFGILSRNQAQACAICWSNSGQLGVQPNSSRALLEFADKDRWVAGAAGAYLCLHRAAGHLFSPHHLGDRTAAAVAEVDGLAGIALGQPVEGGDVGAREVAHMHVGSRGCRCRRGSGSGSGMRCLSFAGQGNVRQPLPVVSTAIPQLDGCPTQHESWSR
jgi:hypothetical protein